MFSRALAVIFFLAALASSIGNWRQSEALNDLRRKPAATRSDRPYVQRAVAYWARKDGVDVSQAMNGRYAKVIYFGHEACVALDIELGGVGGVPVYCFDTRDGRLTRRYDDVE